MNTVDLHVDTIWRLIEVGGDLLENPQLAVDVARAREGGVRAIATACFTSDDCQEPRLTVRRMLDRITELNDDPTVPVRVLRRPGDFANLGEDEIGLIPTIENARSMEGQIEVLEEWASVGVAILGVTWNGANELAVGCHGGSGGLTDFGRKAVNRAAELGIATDISHLNPESAREVLSSQVPVLATHSNCRQVHDHPRNLSDDQLQALAGAKGVLGLNLYPPFLGTGEVSIQSFVRHVQHCADLIGVEYLALGTDLDGIDETASGFRDHRDLPRLQDALEAAGFSRQEVAGIFSENFIRWWEEVRHGAD